MTSKETSNYCADALACGAVNGSDAPGKKACERLGYAFR